MTLFAISFGRWMPDERWRNVESELVLLAGHSGTAAIINDANLRLIADPSVDVDPAGTLIAYGLRSLRRPSLAQVQDCADAGQFAALHGEFATVRWDKDARRITLYRDLCGAVPLYFMRSGAGWCVASHPLLLAATQGFGLDRIAVQRQLLEFTYRDRSCFEGIEAAMPGQTVVLTDDGVARIDPPLPAIGRPRSIQEWSSEYLSELDRAVEGRLPPTGRIAVHLSSGLDSSSVAYRTAAITRDRERIVTLTVAPAIEIASIPRYRFADESEIAARTAKQLGIEHHIFRTSGPALIEAMDRHCATSGEPCWAPVSARWWQAGRDLARELGAETLLTGEMGNVTLHWGGLPVLRDYRDQRSPMTFAKELVATKRRNDIRWRGIAAALLPSLSKPYLTPWRSPFVKSELTFPSDHGLGSQAWRYKAVVDSDPGLGCLAASLGWGLRESDPTGDSRLVRWSLSLPPEAFLRDGRYRPVAMAALADGLSEEVLLQRKRGMQITDWPYWFDQQTARDLWEEGRASDEAREFLDFDAMDRAIVRWPDRDFNIGLAYRNYPQHLARALGLAHFLARYLPSKRAAMRSTSSSSRPSPSRRLKR